MDALRLPPVRLRGHAPLRRRAPPRRAVPAAAQRARPAAARRADQPPRRRVRRLARAAPGRVQGRDRRGHPRSLLPRQRRPVDPRDRPLARHPVRGQLLRLARAEAEAAAAGGAQGVLAPAHDRGRARVGAHRTRRAGASKNKARLARYEELLAEDRNVKLDQVQIHIPAGKRLGDTVHRGQEPAQGLRRQAADRGPVVHAAARGHRRRHRPQRRRQDDAVQDDHRARSSPTPGTLRVGDTVEPRLRRPVARRARPRQDGLGGDLRRLRRDQGRRPRR